MPVWLVTGATGYLGGHLLDVLASEPPPGLELATLGRRPARFGTFHEADLDDPASLTRALTAAQPAVVLHLAGKTPPASAEELERGNAQATTHLVTALEAWGGPARLVLAGSAAELGTLWLDELPVGEGHPCQPAEPYGQSKHRATLAALAARPPLEAVVGRIFNPIGPGQPASQAFGRFAALLADPTVTTLTVGDLHSRRDFIDVRDVARALIALATKGRSGRVFHIGTGRPHRVREGLDRLIRLSGRKVEIKIEITPGKPRPTDSYADIARIVAETGWRPAVAWEQSLADLWDEARRRAGCP